MEVHMQYSCTRFHVLLVTNFCNCSDILNRVYSLCFNSWPRASQKVTNQRLSWWISALWLVESASGLFFTGRRTAIKTRAVVTKHNASSQESTVIMDVLNSWLLNVFLVRIVSQKLLHTHSSTISLQTLIKYFSFWLIWIVSKVGTCSENGDPRCKLFMWLFMWLF